MNGNMAVQRPGGMAEADAVGAALFERWINYLDAKPRTVEAYSKAMGQFLRYLAERGVTQPGRADVLAYRDHLAEGRKPATVQLYLMAVKQFFKWTAQEGMYPNISENVKGARLDRGFKRDYLTAAQVGRMLEAIDRSTLKGLRDYAMLALMVTTGLRTVEVRRANREDMRNLAGFTALYIQGKGREERSEYVKVEPPVEEAVGAYLRARGKSAGDSPLFASTSHRNSGGRLTTRSISRAAKESLVRAGLDSDRLTAHSLRHTAATLNLLNGGTPEETRQLLRHSSLNTTLLYSHALERAENQSEARVAKAIFG